jgi:hypothetical protein
VQGVGLEEDSEEDSAVIYSWYGKRECVAGPERPPPGSIATFGGGGIQKVRLQIDLIRSIDFI